MGTLTLRFDATVFTYAAAVLAALTYVVRGVSRITKTARDVLGSVRRLRIDVALLKRSQGVALSRSERELLDQEGE